MPKQSCSSCVSDILSFNLERPLMRQRKSALLSATVATFLSCTYLVAKPNLQDVVVFDLSKVYLLLTSLIGVTIFSSATPSEPWVVSIPTLIYALWLTSLVVSLGCTTFVVLLQRRVLLYLLMTRPQHSPRVYRGVSIYTTQGQSLIVLEALFRGLRASLLMSNFLFLWGLGIQLLNGANPPSVLIVFGLSLTCFLGQYLILFAIQDFPSCGTEASSV
jgi:Family of unknown function (DUF6535)